MFVKIALILLAAWALGIGWLYPQKPVHILLFAGLLLLLLGFLKDLDAAKRASRHDSPKQP
jgi:uncharacterized protein YqgC (DUF456 family)